MASTPRLVPNNSPQSLANATRSRVNAMAATMATEASPVRVYNPAADVEVATDGNTITTYTWTCPDDVTSVQVECYGGGGGGGGGAPTTQGAGAGGGGAEYVCEPEYPVVPGEVYSYFAGNFAWGGLPDVANSNNAPGVNGPDTIFDPRGKGITGGVIAHGGQGGDQGGPGVPGMGGTGSANTIHFDGGMGGGSGGKIYSDNPWNILASSHSDLKLWYRFDESRALVAYDYSDNARQSVQVFKVSSHATVSPSGTGGSPVQMPAIGDRNGNPIGSGDAEPNLAWIFDRGTGSGAGYVQAPGFAFGGATWTKATLSVWVKGSLNATSTTDWGASRTSGQHTTILGNADTDSMSNGGMWLGFNANGAATFVVRTDTGTLTVTGGSLNAQDNTWHMITGVFHANTSSGMVLYVDGTAVSTINTTGSTVFMSGPQAFCVGMDKASSGFYYNGYASNFYVAGDAYSAFQVSQAFGTAVTVGGGGGGGSGGSAGAGNAGGAGSGNTGGAGGASAGPTQPGINNGASAGAAGGTNANTGGHSGGGIAPFGGAGGGSASYSSSVTGVNVLTIPCLRSASYAGYDATGGYAGMMYTVSESPSGDSVDPYYSASAKEDGICYTGGQSGSPFNGSMNTILVIPPLSGVVGGLNGSTPTYLGDKTKWDVLSVFLNLTIETENAATMAWSEWVSNNLPTAVNDTTLAAGGYTIANGVIHIPAGAAGRTVTVPLNDGGTFAAALQNNALSNGHGGQGVGLILGNLQGSATFQALSDGAWDAPEAPDWFCTFHGAENGDTGLAASITMQYVTHGSYASLPGGGAGDPGYIVISFIDPNGVPVATVLPNATTDAGGNALGAGFTADSADYEVWQPGSNPRTLETWHSVSSLSGNWAFHTGGTTISYRIMPGNLLVIKVPAVDGSSAGADTLFTLPVGWRPTVPQFHAIGCTTLTNSNTYYQIGSDGTVNITNGHGNGLFIGNLVISLDAT